MSAALGMPTNRSATPVTRRLLVVTLLVATVAVLVTAITAVGFVRSVDVTAARNSLESQADRVANTRAELRIRLVRGLSEIDGELVALVSATGPIEGSATDLVPARVVAQLRAGEDVSTLSRFAGRTYLIEAQASADGGGVVFAQDASSVRSLTPDVVGRIAFALLIGLAVAAVAALVAARRLSLPLAGLARRARRLASGERGVAGRPSGVSEIDQVDAALTGLDDALVRSEGRQHEFLLSISHEIRTPLTALRGYAEALAEGVVRPDELATIGQTLQTETARLTRFTDDLLALARLEADDFSLDLADDVVPGDIAQAVAKAWRARGAAAGVEIVVAAEPAQVCTDPHRLRQVIDGLVENALRVSPIETRIEISAQPRPGGGAVITVTDQGPGITADDAAHAFERARLRDRYRDSRPVGSGLGLSIAARLVTRLGGTITARPGDPGAVFRIDLPARPDSG